MAGETKEETKCMCINQFEGEPMLIILNHNLSLIGAIDTRGI